MSKTLTEQKALRKLGIDNFRQITKDKILEMYTMLDKMDPEVAKKALEQIPEFSKTMREIFSEYQKSIDVSIEQNGESIRSYYASCDEIISSLQKELDKDNLSFEERRYVMDLMMNIVQMENEKDSENKRFIVKLVTIPTVVIGVVVTAFVTALAGNTKIDMDSIKKIG